MMDTERGQEEATNMFEKLFGNTFSKEGGKQAAQALIGAKLGRRVK
jgi:hypothetical protein